jgi:Uma2 family endonuclease
MATGSLNPQAMGLDGVLTDERIEAVKAELRETDEEPLETPWHRAEINLLIDSVSWQRRGQTDFYVGGNMFNYYSLTQSRNWEYRGPDFFFVKGVDGTRVRRFWWVFEEGKFPNVITELLSSSTAETDRTTKKDIYQQTFRTPEYFCYDPESKLLEGWHLQDRYKPIVSNEKGWLWSQELELWLGTWDGAYLGLEGTWLRFFDSQGNLVLTETEFEHRRAETEKQRAETEKQRAETEKQRADNLEQQMAKLQALLKDKNTQ